MNVKTQTRMNHLWKEMITWVKENNIHCDETVYQTDHAQEALLDLALRVTKIVGFAKVDD